MKEIPSYTRLGPVLLDIENYISDMNEFTITRKNWNQDKWDTYSLSMIAFSLLNRVIDLGEVIIQEMRLGVPQHYRDIFSILAKNGIIDETISNELSSLVYYRNLLSHEYQRITTKDLQKILTKISVIQTFLDTIRAGLK